MPESIKFYFAANSWTCTCRFGDCYGEFRWLAFCSQLMKELGAEWYMVFDRALVNQHNRNYSNPALGISSQLASLEEIKSGVLKKKGYGYCCTAKLFIEVLSDVLGGRSNEDSL